ncbi:MAG: hypothetical protein R6X06_11215 [Gammaproteobacteria bacterium]
MFLNQSQHSNISFSLRDQKGITLVGALFIIVVMALLGTGLLQLTTTSQQSIGQEVTSVKAYFAAHSALQWGMYQAAYAGAAANGAHTLTFSSAGLINTTGTTDISSRTLEGRNFYLIQAAGRYGISSDPEFALRNLQLRFEF